MTSFSNHIERIQTGDRQALEKLMERWRPILRLHSRGMLGHGMSARGDSSDVVQETMTLAYCHIDQFSGDTEAQWGAWLHRILKNEAARYRRRHLASKRTVSRESYDAQEEMEVNPQPLGRAIELENAVAVAAAIEELTPLMREIVIRRAFHHDSFNEIAEAINRSAGTVRVTWARALAKLGEALGDSGEKSSSAG